MSDIEVFDTITWSWTSTYIPSPGYAVGNGHDTGINGPDNTGTVISSTPSMAIVAGAITGVLVVLVLVIVALYMFHYHQKRQKVQEEQEDDDDPNPVTPIKEPVPQRIITTTTTPAAAAAAVYSPHPPSSSPIPSPWTPSVRQSFPPATADVRRAATMPYYYYPQYCFISKPDEEPIWNRHFVVRRAATTPKAAASSNKQQAAATEDDEMFDQQEFILRMTDDQASASQEEEQRTVTETEQIDKQNDCLQREGSINK